MVASMLRLSVSGLALLASTVTAHTWIEQMQVIDDNGSYTGDYGYPRGYVARTDPTFTGFSDKYQAPSPDTDNGKTRIDSSMFACHPEQRSAKYSSQYPKLSVTPGDWVAMRYLENGHVSQPNIPEGKPKGSGTVYIYGTYKPNETETLMNVLSWTSDGKGGDGNGWLMAAQNYDDGRCYQINGGPISVNRQALDGNSEQWCESNLQVPANAPVDSVLTVYWVWSWPTEGPGCKDEYYTTCSDFDVVGDVEKVSAESMHSLEQQNMQNTAVSDYKSRTAYTPTPLVITTSGCDATAAPPQPIAASSASAEAPQLSSAPQASSAPALSSNLSPPAAPHASAPTSAPQLDSAPTAITSTETATVTEPSKVVFKTVTIPASSANLPPSPTSGEGMIGKGNRNNGENGSMQKRAQHIQAHGRLRPNVRNLS
ncbi:hypothetical protein Q7P37_004451 [Cladosporium fusiforme]